MQRVKSLFHIFLFLFVVLIVYEPEQTEYEFDGFSSMDFYAEIPKAQPATVEPLPEYNPVINEITSVFYSRMEQVQLEVVDIHYESLGYYYITAYCDCEKCCYPSTGMTASGTYTHYADYENRYSEPTTCAIDRRYHRFGEHIYVPSEDRIYVTEDTGSAVKGNHIDIYFPNHSTVQYYGSHYEEVYSVSYTKHLERANNYDIHRYLLDAYTNI